MPDLATATPGLLQLFTPELRHEAERLVEDDAVISLDIDADEVVAEVGLDDRSVGVRWLRSESGWKGQSDAGDDLNELVICAVLVAVAKRTDAPTEADLDLEEEDFQAWLERDLGRSLVEGELAYLEKVEKRFRRARQVGEIYDQDMVRLHPRWSIESLEALELWPTPPRSLREFWSYVALALDEKGLAIPKFLLKAGDLKRGRERLARWKRSLQLPRWVERVRTVARAKLDDHSAETEPAALLEDLRVLVTTGELRVQGRIQGEEGFLSLSSSQLAEWGQKQSAGELPLAAEAALLLRLCVDQQREHGSSAFRLDAPEAASLLQGLLAQAALAPRLVTLDEVPLRSAPGPLRWAERLQADGQHLQLELVCKDGSPAPLPLRVLTEQPAVESLYLSGEAIFRGPLWFGEENRVEGTIEVPMAALTSEDGVRFLERLQVPLPETIISRITHEPLSVEVRAGCLAKSALSSAEYVVFQVNGLDEKGRVVERMRTTGWEEVAAQEAEETDGRIIIRDRAQLGRAEQALEVFRTTFDPEHQAFRVRLTRQFPDQFHAWANSLPEGVALHPDERLQTILADPLIARVRLEARQTESIDWFDLRMMFEIDGAELNTAEIRRLVAARGGFVRLADGSWKRVELQLSEEQQAMIDQLGIELEELGADSHRLHWRQLANENAELLVPAQAWKMVSRRLAAAELEERPPVPPNLKLTLRPYQVDGYHFLTYLTLNRFGGILADDMGLGKTVQSIAWMLWLRSQQPPGEMPPPVLVICPKSVLDVWGAELAKTAPELAVQVLRERDELSMEMLTAHLDVLVINYAQLRGAIGELKAVNFLAVILDEGQQIKNPDSQAARAARQLNAQNRLVLTGTPLENRLLDLWSLMTFATPGALGDRSYFQKHFDRRKDGRAAARLSARLRPFLLRRTKGQVARDLPSRSEEALLCEMTDEQNKLYQGELARAQQMVLTASTMESMNRNRFAILQALTRLRQICCQPQLVHGPGKHGDSAKLTATLELIEELHAEGHKVLLFSQFVKMLEILRDRLMDMGVPYHWLTGATSDRASVVKAFQEDEEASVFLLSLKAGGSGLNLTAASYVILYDPWWNPAVEAQAIDRAHRIGQTQPVMAYRMITKATIEEKILLLQQKKQMMSANVLGEEAFSRTLDRNDFAFLFDLEREEAEWQEELKGGGGI